VGADRSLDGRRCPPAGAQQGFEAQSEQEGKPKACHREADAADRDAGDGGARLIAAGREKDMNSPPSRTMPMPKAVGSGGQKAVTGEVPPASECG